MDNFEKRLLEACAGNDDIPQFGKGQQTYLAEKLNISQEAVRKWFAGDTVPRQRLCKDLAKVLGVKHSWLALGTGHGEINTDIMTARRHEHTAYAVMSYLVAKGIGASFNGDNHFTDIMMIDQGRVRHLAVEEAVEQDKGVFTATFSEAQISEGSTIVLVKDFSTHRSVACDFIEIDGSVWKALGKKEGKNVTVEFTQTTRSFCYTAGAMKLSKFLED
jgi:transcriptional regulator with XRE-family HTH domain